MPYNQPTSHTCHGVARDTSLLLAASQQLQERQPFTSSNLTALDAPSVLLHCWLKACLLQL
jgi:hypothetical protein